MIIDASVAAHWFAETEFSEPVAPYRRQLNLIGPGFLVVETANVLYKQCRAGKIERESCGQSVEELELLLSEIVPDRQLLPAALELALEWHHPVYDCLYVALGIERRDLIVTADRKLAALATKAGIHAELVEAAR